MGVGTIRIVSELGELRDGKIKTIRKLINVFI